MNIIKKLLASLTAFVMAVGFMIGGSLPVMAAGEGSITIRNTQPEKTYSIYKVFDATYQSSAPDNVSYTYNGSDTTFIAALKNTNSPFNFNENTKTVSLRNGKNSTDITTFLNNQKDHLGSAVGNSPVSGTGSDVTISNLDLGYYYVTTTTGSAVSITTTRPSATIVDKNEAGTGPNKTETTAENPTEADWVKDTTANIGDTVKYKVTGTIQRYQSTGAGPVRVTSLNLVDTMSAGLTMQKDVVIKVTEPGDSPTPRTLNVSTDYTVSYDDSVRTTTIVITTSTGTDDNPVFTFKSGTAYEITYSAKLNSNAEIANANNKNTVDVKYNNNIEQGTDTTTVKTYGIGLFKRDNENNALTGAEFKLYTSQNSGTPLKVKLTSEGTTEDPTRQYRIAEDQSDSTATDTLTVGSNGKFTVAGLKNGTYWFEETKAPNGYNLLTERKSVTINNANASLEVENLKGSILPSTGGIGTTIFYVAGSVITIAAVGLMMVRRKRNA